MKNSTVSSLRMREGRFETETVHSDLPLLLYSYGLVLCRRSFTLCCILGTHLWLGMFVAEVQQLRAVQMGNINIAHTHNKHRAHLVSNFSNVIACDKLLQPAL